MNYLSRRAVFITASLLVLVVVTGTAAALLLYRNAALAGGEWHLKNIAVALAEQTRQGVLTVDLALRATAEEYGGQVMANRLSAQFLQERMHRRAEELPQVRALSVINPEGGLIAHSEAFPAPQVDYGDRDYFAVQRDPVSRQVFFGTPVKGRVLQEWTYPLSRRISGAKDEFLGVATAAVDFPYFHEVYRSLELGPRARIFIFRRDGVLLTSFPQESEGLGRSYAGHALFSSAATAASSGVLRTEGLDDDASRLIAYRSLPEYSLVLAVSFTTEYVLAQWRRQSLYAALGALAAIAFILSAAFLLARQLRVSQDLTGEVLQSERRWLSAVEAAGHGVWDWDVAPGKIVFSAQYYNMLGYSETEMPADREGWLQLLHPEDRELAQQSSEACVEGRVDSFSTELRLRSRDGGWKWVLNRGMAVSRDAQGRALRVLGTTTDVTASQQAQELLSDSAARLNAIIGSAMDAIITIDQNQNIMLFNAAAERIFRCPARGAPGLEAIGAPLDRFIPDRYRKTHRSHIEQFGRTGVTMRRMGGQIALTGVRANGEEFPIDASISQVEIGGEKFYTVILRDITERQTAALQLEQSHRELRELYGVMHEVREAERIRIARELHDELAQWLTALKMDVSWMAARLPDDLTRLIDRTAKMKEVVDTTVAAVRRIAADLRPVMIDDLGLLPAIEHLLHEFSQRSGIMVSLDAKVDEVEFRDPLATAVYRMVQEALTNVARHAEATLVAVALSTAEDNLVVRVRDNGRGIDEAALHKAKSYGVLGIRERAHTLGGTATISRAAEGGTTVEITIPLRAHQRGQAIA